MKRRILSLGCLGAFLMAAEPADEMPTAGNFIVERIAVVDSRSVPRLEALPNSGYGEGILVGLLEQGFLHLTRHSGAGTDEFASLGPFNQEAQLVTLRFDSFGHFGHQLLATVGHDGGSGRGNSVTDIYSIDPRGHAKLLQRIGGPTDPVLLNLAVSPGIRGHRPGLYLQDRNIVGGSSLYHLDPSHELTLLDDNLLPPGRRDLDVQGMQFDPIGLYSSHLFVSDRDDHDRLSGLYLLDAKLKWSEVLRPEPTTSLRLGELAFSSGGTFDIALYVVERVRERVIRVSPTGGTDDFASGFDGIESLTIDASGNTMYVADRQAIYRIHASER